jgi:hypothetical protein
MHEKESIMKKKYFILSSFLLFLFFAWDSAEAQPIEQQATGRISAITSSSVTVNLLTCSLTRRTNFIDQFWDRIKKRTYDIGDEVMLTCRNGVATTLVMLADNRKSCCGNSQVNFRLRTQFFPVSGVATSATGSVNYRLKRNGSTRDDQLAISVKIPIPSTIPFADTYTSARALLLQATLSRNDVPFAVCTLQPVGRSVLNTRPAIEFRVDTKDDRRSDRGRAHAIRGTCDIDLMTPGMQQGLPVILMNDTIVVRDSVAGDFLQGKF